MRAFPVQLPSGVRYWTVVDDDLAVVPEADAFLRYVRFGRDQAELTTRTYAGHIALYLRWCIRTGRDWRVAAIAAYNLPTAPPKATDRRSFSGPTTQAEALPPDILAAIVREAIEAHRDPEVHRQALAREEAKRRALRERLSGRPEPGQPPAE